MGTALLLFWWVILEMLYTNVIASWPTADYCTFEKEKLKCEENFPNISYPCGDISVLQLSNVSWETLDLTNLIGKFPNLYNLTIDGRGVVQVFPPNNVSSIRVLQLRKLLIANISSTFLENFPKIEVLNLEGNRLKSLPAKFTVGSLSEIYLRYNQWNCSEDLDWVLNLNRSIVKDLDKLSCYGPPHAGKPLVEIAQYLKDIREECTDKCECSLSKLAIEPSSDKLRPIIMVNCSNRGFTDLPDKLPRNTKILHLEGNHIESLKPLKVHPLYRGLWDLYLDHNNIETIGVLEGSHWLTHFRAFSLRGNKLTKVPSYALDNALEKNSNMPNGVSLFLGDNPWRCDCVFTPVFQEMLRKYSQQVKDLPDVKCSYVEGDKNSLSPIEELSRSSVCRLPTEYSVQNALDLLNAVLASLIIFILGKLAYDYYHFKKTGKLPWIVTKMP